MGSMAKEDFILLGTFDFILFILLSTAIQQFCASDNFKSKARLRRVLLICINIFLYLILNSLLYTSELYPHHRIFHSTLNLKTLYILFQAITALIGFRTYRLLLIFIIGNIHTRTNIRAPKYFMFFVNTLEFTTMIAIVICHGLCIANNDETWMYIFYIYFGVAVLLWGVFVIVMVRRPMQLLADIPITADNKKKIGDAMLYMKSAIYAAVFICTLMVIDIVFTVEKLMDFFGWTRFFDFELISHIQLSLILSALSSALILWIYVPGLCCFVPKDSICDLWCCGCLDDGMDDFSALSGNPISILLQESTTNHEHPINTGNINGARFVKNAEATVTTLEDVEEETFGTPMLKPQI